MLKAAIYILTQNKTDRKIYLKSTLYFLFKNFNSKYKYPVIILHEGDFDDDAKNEILTSIRLECTNLVSFQELDKEDFQIPKHIDIDKMNKLIDLNPVPYWRNVKYRIMCNFWVNHFFKYCKQYEYVMRLDDDSIIEEPIKIDLFNLMKEKDLNYISNILHLDCGICNYEMNDFFSNIIPEKKELINKSFANVTVYDSDKNFDSIKKLHELLKNEKYTKNSIDVYMPVMYYNNFFITKNSIWNDSNIKKIIKEIDKKGYIFYCRWGDAPLHTMIMKLYDSTKIGKYNFKYSKRLQRESFKDINGNYHRYMPEKYNSDSCLTKNIKK
jgi:hypothetical protein